MSESSNFLCSQKNPSNVGKWDAFYQSRPESLTYGNTISYVKAAEFFSDIETVEDWGCGGGGFRQFWTKNYVGVDGSRSNFADVKADLATYPSEVEAIFMRHVLEHNVLWKFILSNAVASFRKKFCLVLFTPFVDQTQEIAYYPGLDVPDIAFAIDDITSHFSGLTWRAEQYIVPESQYNTETLFYISR